MIGERSLRPAIAQRVLRAVALSSLMLFSTTGCARQGNDMSDRQTFGNPTHAPLADAVRKGDAKLARELVAGGANPNASDEKGMPLLQWAMLRDDRDAFRLLLDLRADPAQGNRSGQTAMHLAAMAKSRYWLETLLERGVSPDLPNTVTGAPPLFDALRAQSQDNIDRLLDAGARLDTRDRSGTTPLHQAALVNNLAAVRRFLDAGADPRATDRNGATFDAFLFDGDESTLNASAKRDLEAIRARLRSSGIEPARSGTH